MTDFKIRRGLFKELFPPELNGKLNSKLIVEEGCWYLCTDTADLFLGVSELGKLGLKRINGSVLNDHEQPGTSSDTAALAQAISLIEQKLAALETVELFKKISSESELPTDFTADDFNPNITYYIVLDDNKASTYIFDKDAQSYMCTNGIAISECISIIAATINSAGELVLQYSNGEHSIVGKVVGSDGKDGVDGADGKDGTGISFAAINSSGELVLTLSDKTELNLGNIRGENGKPGKDGLTTSIKVGETLYKHENGVIELPNFATHAFVSEKLDAIEIPKIPSKISAFENDVGYLTTHQDLSEYAKKTDLPNVDNFATEEFVNAAIAEAALGDKVLELDGYATKEDIKDFATISFVETKIAAIPSSKVPLKVSELENDLGFITETTLDTVITEKLPPAIHQTLETVILHGGDATPD